MNEFLQVFLLTTLGSIAGLIGGMIILVNKQIANRLSVHAIPFAVGVMLSVAFLDLLPESLEHMEASTTSAIILAVIILAFLAEKFILQLHHHDEHPTNLQSTTKLVVVGDTIHNFIDGVVIATSFLVKPELGFVVALATFCHEVPHEIGDFVVMLSAGWKRSKILLVNLLSALSTYLGVLCVFLFSESFSQHLGVPLAVAAGLFIYIGASDLLPELQHNHKDSPWHQTALLLLGIGMVVLISQFVPH